MLEQYLSSLKPTTNKQDQAEAVRQASLNGWGGGTYSQLMKAAQDKQNPVEYSAVATGYAPMENTTNVQYSAPVTGYVPMENTKTNYSDKYLAALQPVFQAQEAKKADLKRTHQDNKDRIREVEDIIKKYTDEAIKAQGESRQAKTLSPATQALTAERKMGQEKAGREQALIKNLGSQGAIGTTGAVDIASAGIGAEYESNLDELQSRRVTRMGEINDLYLSESDRINKEYANDQQKLSQKRQIRHCRQERHRLKS